MSESRIAFVNNATGFKELFRIDYDGKNLKRLTNDKDVVVLPRWSPDFKHILYTSYKNNNPDLYEFDLITGRKRRVSKRQGLNTAPSYTPDGKNILLTLSIDKVPHLYLIKPNGRMVRRLTHGSSANTSSSYSPDGRKIVYVSDRPGYPQIYMMDADGSNKKRLTRSGFCDSPVWSPRGDKIAYSRGNSKGNYHIVVYDVATGQEYEITHPAARNEDPSFSLRMGGI